MPYWRNRFGAALGALERREGFSDSLDVSVMLAQNALLSAIKQVEPHGHKEQIYDMTVSARLGHKPISEGWRFGREDIQNGTRFTLSNVSEHILAVLKGTPPHREPSAGRKKMYFWWGHPHRWPARDDAPPGPRIFYSVSHPGATANPFLGGAIKDARPGMKRAIAGGVRGYIVKTLTDAGFKWL